MEIFNRLTDLIGSLGGSQKALPQTTPTSTNIRANLISNDRQLLSYLYVEQGLIQTLVDQPVEDAFRNGFTIKTSQLEPEEITELYSHLKNKEIITKIKQVIIWARLYGGASLMIVNDDDPREELKIEDITGDSRLGFLPTDMWELYNMNPQEHEAARLVQKRDENYNYYGTPIHPSRVLAFKGKEAPAYLRNRLRGWGMSEVERVISSLNSYLKNNNVIYELLDEAKTDVYKMDGFNSLLKTDDGTDDVLKRVQLGNRGKNYLNALVMDVEDEYEQKQMSFSGLGEIMTQSRQAIASDWKMPITKLFGVSSSGFNSGEEDLQNYNAMLKSQVQEKADSIIMHVVQIVAQQKYGIMLDDLEIEWEALKVLNAEQEENVKNQKLNRTLQAYRDGVIEVREVKESINQEHLVPVDIDVSDEVFETGLNPDENLLEGQ